MSRRASDAATAAAAAASSRLPFRSNDGLFIAGGDSSLASPSAAGTLLGAQGAYAVLNAKGLPARLVKDSVRAALPILPLYHTGLLLLYRLRLCVAYGLVLSSHGMC